MFAIGLVLVLIGYILQSVFPPSIFYYSWRDWGYYSVVVGAGLILGSLLVLAWRFLP